ncbi:MAG: ArnT family glycosyltransferase [Gemmatimonadota bacterium]
MGGLNTPAVSPNQPLGRPGAIEMLAVLVGAAILLAPTLSYRMGVDQGAFAYIGDQLLAGRWPYLGTWESDYPGMMFLQALELLLFGRSIVMFRVFDVLFQLGIVIFLYLTARRLSGRGAGVLGVGLYCLIYQGYGPWNTAQREGFGLLFVMLALWLLITRMRRDWWKTAGGIGVALGTAALFKPTLLALAAFALPLAWPIDRRVIRSGLVAGLAAAAPALILIALYAVLGGLKEMYEALVSYTPIYTARLRGDDPTLVFWMSKLGSLGTTTWAVALLGFPLMFLGPSKREIRFVYAGYLGAGLGVFVQGTFAGYHYLPGLAFGALLIGYGYSVAAAWCVRRLTALPRRMGKLGVRMRDRANRWQTGVAVVIVALLIPIYVNPVAVGRLVSGQFLGPPEPGEFTNGTVFDFTESYEVAQYLRQHTDPTDVIQVWGYEALVYYLAERGAASRFQMTHPLVMRVPGEALTEMQQAWRREFIEDMRQREPKFVAVVREDNWWWAPGEQTSEQLLSDFVEFESLIGDRYVHDRDIGRFRVFRIASTPVAEGR